jgi:hypothetical protein
MASGSPILQIIRVLPLSGTNGAYLVNIAGGSTPNERYTVWTFPDAAARYVDFLCAIKGYAAGGLTLRIGWSSLATANNCVWQAAVRRISDDADDMDTSHTYDYNTVTATTASAVNEVAYDNITFTDGADMDSWADGEMAILRIKRDPAHASDSLANTAYLWGVFGYET